MRRKMFALAIALFTAGVAVQLSPAPEAATVPEDRIPCQSGLEDDIGDAKDAFRNSCDEEWDDQQRHQCTWVDSPSKGWVCHEHAPSGLKSVAPSKNKPAPSVDKPTPSLTNPTPSGPHITPDTDPATPAAGIDYSAVSSSPKIDGKARRADVGTYWTAERMRNAVPLDNSQASEKIKSRDIKGPSEPGKTNNPGPATNNPAPATNRPEVLIEVAGGFTSSLETRVTGKMFMTVNGRDSSCGGAVIDSAGKSSVWTAGHCLHLDGTWHKNVAFAPSYNHGYAPHGIWEAQQSWSLAGWTQSQSLNFDLGVIVVEHKDGKRIADVVGGGAGLLFNRGSFHPDVEVIGYPGRRSDDATVELDGNRRTCSSRSFLSRGHLAAACAEHGPGGSGGPWFASVNGRSGLIVGTSSYTALGTGIVHSSYFGNEALALYRATENL